MSRVYSVYKGEQSGKVVYVGTTIQKPADRFRWHKHNGKPFEFTVLSTHDNADDMLAEELRLIKQYRPKHNKRMKQNFNVKLSPEQLDARKGDTAWCQSCLKRRVNTGYKTCYYCGRR